jgi:hypothetical protein
MHRYRTLGFVLGLVTASAVAGPLWADAEEVRVPEGLSASDWSSIRAAYEANSHAAFAVEDGYVARNPGQQWRTRFDGRGFVTTPDGGNWSWGLELVSYGREEQSPDRFDQSPDRQGGVGSRMQPPSYSHGDRSLTVAALSGGAAISACGQRIEYEWNDTLTEWYVNDPRGLEHGYTVHRRPDAEGVVRASRPSAPLQFTLAVRGDLRLRVSGDGRNVAFVNDAGAAVVNYSGLTVFDATGAAVPAWFECEGMDGRDARTTQELDERDARTTHHFGERDASTTRLAGSREYVRIVVDDARAVYPLTIDPIAQQAYLKASNTDVGSQFGISVAASGDTVVVGANQEDSSATGVNGDQADNSAFHAGAAYVFVRSGGVWSQQAYLKASNTGADDVFGESVAVSGDTVVVGARLEDSNATGVNGNQADNIPGASGAAYVFVRDAGGVWSQQAYLKASNTGANDQFGVSVAVSGDTVVVGAHREGSSATGVNGSPGLNTEGNSGAAYVFVRVGGVWSQHAYLKASNTGAQDEFGESVAVSGDTVVVGAAGERSSATGVDGNQADNSALNSGAAYVFVRDAGGVWSQQAYLKASNTGVSDHFGKSVAVSGDTVVVGATSEDSNATGVNGDQADNSTADSGAAYVFVMSVPCPTLGDMNCDCAVDLPDVDTFVLALLDPAGYAAAHPACDILHGDMQPDGNVNGGDVQGFIDQLVP